MSFQFNKNEEKIEKSLSLLGCIGLENKKKI